MSVVDHGSVLLALPNIEGHFGTDLPTVQWVIVGYSLAISVLLLPMGRLGDIMGRKEIYMGGLLVLRVVICLVRGERSKGMLLAQRPSQLSESGPLG